MNRLIGEIVDDAFMESLDWIDIVFALLAIATAYKVTAGDVGDS